MGFRSQQNTSVIVSIIYWGASSERRHLSLYYTTHTFHQALEEIVSQIIALNPRLFIHSYNYRSSNIHKCQAGLLLTPNGYSGWLLRTTPDYSGWLRRPQGSRYPPQGPAWPWRNHLQDFLSPLCRFCLPLRLPD